MDVKKIIEEKYLEAVKGIKEEWLREVNSYWYNYIIGLPREVQITYLIVVFHDQVFNGGFHQYFANGYGQFAVETIKALNTIGANLKGKLLEEALAKVNLEGYDNETFRENLLKRKIDRLFVSDELFEPLSKINDRYDETQTEDLERLLENYLKGNRNVLH